MIKQGLPRPCIKCGDKFVRNGSAQMICVRCNLASRIVASAKSKMTSRVRRCKNELLKKEVKKNDI